MIDDNEIMEYIQTVPKSTIQICEHIFPEFSDLGQGYARQNLIKKTSARLNQLEKHSWIKKCGLRKENGTQVQTWRAKRCGNVQN